MYVTTMSLLKSSQHTWLFTSDKVHNLGISNLVEKYLSYNKIGNLVSFASISPLPQTTFIQRYNNLPVAAKRSQWDF